MSELQLDLFLEAPPPPPPPRGPDRFAARLVELGLVGSEWLLQNNRTLSPKGPVPVPGRLFRFPLEWVDRDRLGNNAEESILLLNHPLIGDHPFVRQTAELIGEPIVWADFDEFGRDRGAMWRFFHALDLATDELMLHLIDNPQYTDSDGVLSGIAIGLRHGNLQPKFARTIASAFGLEEPADRSESALSAGVIRPDPIFLSNDGKPIKNPRWGMNDGHGGDLAPGALTWAILHGLEAGYFGLDKSKHLTMKPAGCERLGFSVMGEKL